MAQRPRTALQRLEKSVGQIASAATAQMERDLPWFRQLSAEDRSWIGLIVQAGIRSFVSWAGDPKRGSITADIFGTAPQKLTRVITLQQTVEMVRMSIDVIEGMIDDLVGPDDAPVVHEAVLLFGREVAFGTAEVYARAAEMRGAWDARLEALVVDSV
ncbi:MAG: PucR family transcriptional regulator, partial [Nocardioidaceae bacterium]